MQYKPLLVGIFCLSLLLTLIIEKSLIPLLSRKAKQPIYQEGPSWHIAKEGTPTMGGIGFIIPICLILSGLGFYYLNKGSPNIGISIIIIALYSLLNSMVGIFDDLVKLWKKTNGGLTPIQKLILQFLLAVLFLMSRSYYFKDTTTISFVFGTINQGIFYYPLAIILLLGIINCANLTDGIDGLASWVSLSSMSIILFLYNKVDVLIVCSSIIGAMLAFLYFNSNPARVFMGDTGSLFLGALAASLGFSLGNPTSSVMFGIVYVIEGISVILQVIIFKLTKKRLFRMAPLHHHLEKCGLSENAICVLAIIVTLIFTSLCGFFITGNQL